MKRKNRWYDHHDHLAEAFELLRETHGSKRERYVNKCLELITKQAPDAIEKHHLEFPLEGDRRRWYDVDPYLWIMVNSLEFASHEVRTSVAHILIDALTKDNVLVEV